MRMTLVRGSSGLTITALALLIGCSGTISGDQGSGGDGAGDNGSGGNHSGSGGIHNGSGGNGSGNGGNGSGNGGTGNGGTGNGAFGGYGGGGGIVTDPGPTKLLSQLEVQRIAGDATAWAMQKTACDGGMTKFVGPDYAGLGWRAAAETYGMCYQVAKHKNLDATTVSNYAKKTIATMKVLARHHFYGTPDPTQEFVAVGDGSKKSFALRMPLASGTATTYLTTLAELKLTNSGATTSLPGFYPVIKVSDASGGAASYTRDTDYVVGYPGELEWTATGKHPASGASFYATVANGSFTTASGATVSGSTLTFTTAPAAGQGIFVSYMGPDFEQTGNYLGGIQSVKPDSGYAMRSVNVGLAEGYDAVREAAEFTGDLRQEFYTVLNGQVDWFQAYVKINPYNDGELSNYFVRGHLTGTVFTAFATDDDNPRAKAGGDLKPLAQTLLMKTFNSLGKYVPGGYGPEGSYESGTNSDELRLFNIWANQMGTDLAGMLDWANNLIPATIHATKPDLSYYDGGDWSTLPAIPPTTMLQSFVQFQPNHRMTPFVRQLLSDLNAPSPITGTTTPYKSGASAFPLSYMTKGTGAMYARSDWSSTANWVSLAVGPIFEPGHQHYDRAHVTFQRGKDYLIMNAGGYGITNSLPWHNTLGFDDKGAGNNVVYPPGQGAWADLTKTVPPKYQDHDGFVYGQEDFGAQYANTDTTTNAVTRAVRTMVFIRPDIVFIHDQAQVANAATKKYFNINFNTASIVRNGDISSGVTGSSQVFMRSLVPANPTPTILPKGTMANDGYNTPHPMLGSNYQEMLTGQTVDTFLHLFQLAPSSTATMDASTYIKTGDGRAQGAEVTMGSQKWIVMFSVSAPSLTGGTLSYTVPNACPCTHVIGDLPASKALQISVGGTSQTATTDSSGVLTFQTGSGTPQIQITGQ
jgi:hypothetical protein